MNLLHRRRGKVFLCLLAIAVILTEWVSYWVQAWRWPNTACRSEKEDCLRLLLVADPQIIGENMEMGFPVGSLARWDSDRYLSKTFRLAVNHVRPHAVVFLGDLMDEGSMATRSEYARYVQRFSNIFYTSSGEQLVYLPGDNDIGGENEPITQEKISKFQEKFGQPDVIRVKGITLIKVNRLRYTVPKLPPRPSNETRILLSHMPLLPQPSPFIDHVLTSLQPHLVFSAHEHKGLHTASSRDGQRGLTEALAEEVHVFLGATEMEVNEIVVPTCSYRMGVADMGYGAAVLDLASLEMTFNVLWLPGRFPQLFGYVALLTALGLIFCCINCGQLLYYNKKPTKLGFA